MSDLYSSKKLAWVAATLVTLVTLIVYLPALQNGFVNWDDQILVYENPALRSIDIPFIGWAMTDVNTGLWHPMLWLSFAFDYTVWGLNPFGYHLTNVLLHAFNTFLVFILAIQLMGHGRVKDRFEKKILLAGAVTALLFGIHPLHVESVAWVTERKDVLYSFFFLASLLVYLRYASTSLKRYYLLSLIFFILSLMSKPMAISLPAVLFILDFYPLRRLTWEGGGKKFGGVLVEKLPFLLLALLLVALTVWIHPGLESQGIYPLKGRIFVAVHSPISYLFKIALPFDLAPIYPLLSIPDIFSLEYVGSFIALTAITLFSAWALKRGKMFFIIWLYYMATLIPVLGQVGAQPEADRYTYLPSLGPFFLIGIAIGAVFEKCPKKLYHKIIVAVLILISGILASRTVRQIAVWHDPITLWSHVIKLFPDSASVAYYNRGGVYNASGNYRQAIEDYSKAIMISPQFGANYVNRGNVYCVLGNYKEAINDFSKAIELNPKYAISYFNRGNVNSILKNYKEAIRDYDMAIKYNQRFETAYLNRGNAYSELGNYRQAIEDYNRAIEINSQNPTAYRNKEIALLKIGKQQKK